MDLQADISWIRAELKGVTDPILIEAFKQLLNYSKDKSIVRMNKSEFLAEIKEAVEQIKNGDYISVDDFEQVSNKWD